MNKHYLLVFLVIMGTGILYKRSMQGMKRSSGSSSSSSASPLTQAAGKIVLLSSEGEEIALSKPAAIFSPFLRSLLERYEGKVAPVPTPFSAELIGTMNDVLRQVSKETNVDRLIGGMFVSQTGLSDMSLLVRLAKLFDFLQFDEISDALIRLYIFQSLRANNAATIDMIRVQMSRDLGALAPWASGHGRIPSPDIIDKNFALDRSFEYVKTSVGLALFTEKQLSPRVIRIERYKKEPLTNWYGVPLFDPKKVTDLLINGNNLTPPPAETFAKFKDLIKLQLTNNHLTLFEQEAFKGLSNLEILDLSSNALSVIPVGTFSGLGQLQDLDLSYNEFISFSAGEFDGLTQLRQLILRGNPLTMQKSEISALLPNNLLHGIHM